VSRRCDEQAEGRAVLAPDVALHARPAGALVREASRFDAAVQLASNGKLANAKSILEILSLGATAGTELVITGLGQDAAEAVSHLAEFLGALTSGNERAGQSERLLL
jgi:phosphocarrier protein HPr